MAVSSRSLALALAERIGAVMPKPLVVRAEGSAVSLYANSDLLVTSLAPGIVDEVDDRSPADRIEAATLSVLSGLQDAAIQYLRRQWPTGEDGALALPAARATTNQVNLWYGSNEERPAVKLEPIEF
jgi:hypothetical protein